MRVALIHEFLTQYGGAERVLEALLELYPEATIYTLVYDKVKLARFNKYKIKTSFLQNMPLGVSKYKWYLLKMPQAIESFDLGEYELVISDSSAFAKGVITSHKTTHICYCHTPTRYLWNETNYYLKTARIPWPLNKLLPKYFVGLRMWDYLAAQRPDYLIANSQTIKARIEKYYQRTPDAVINPFVDTARFKPSENIKDYFLIAGRMVPYKRNDIVIEAFNDLNVPLKVVGDGYGLKDLKKIAKSTKIEFLGKVSDQQLEKYYREAKALIFPAEEDFGITPLEAMASGRPVIAYKAGGVTETVKEGLTGTFFAEQTPQCLVDTIKKFNDKKYHSATIRQHALNFDKNIFKQKTKKFIEQVIK